MSGIFSPSTIYTATITLAAKADYTLTGVIANSFTVTGATSTNNANSGVVTAVFPSTNAISANDFANGADVGWLSQLESMGVQYVDDHGVAGDVLQQLKAKGVNSIRLRVYVNPASTGKDETGLLMGYCDPASVVVMATRAKNLGFRLMIDFHYSDQWTDLGRQTIPEAWKYYTVAQLSTAIWQHTTDVLTSLKSAGVTPEWVQVGNEINLGMLLPMGTASNMATLTRLLVSGYNAVKQIDSSIKVVIHLANGHDNAFFRTFFDDYQRYGGRWDVIGMSAYLAYGTTIPLLQANLNDMAATYNKEVIVVETGYNQWGLPDKKTPLAATIAAVKAIPNGKGKGVFYWEPEGHDSLTGYQMSSTNWINTNKLSLTEALDAFK